MLAEEIVAAVRSEVGTASSDAVLYGRLNQIYKEMVAEAKWAMATVLIAQTVEGQATYDLPDTVIDLDLVYVQAAIDGGISEYSRTGSAQLIGLKAGSLWLSGDGGVFAPAWQPDGTPQIELFEPPGVDGDSIYGLEAIEPATLEAGMSPKIPADLHGYLIDGVAAVTRQRDDERPDLAQPYDSRFREGKEKLRLRKNSRIGSGPSQIQVEGIHF